MSHIAEFVCWKPAGGPNPVTVDLTGIESSVTVSFVWMHPVTGTAQATGSVLGGAIRSFTPPDGGDWVLFLRRLDLVYSLFGLTGTTPNTGNLGTGTKVVRADVHDVSNGTLLGSASLTVVNTPPNATIIAPPPGWVFHPPLETGDQANYIVFQPVTVGILGIQPRIRPAAGGATVNIGSEITVPEGDGTYRLDPFDPTAYVDGNYLIDGMVRDSGGLSPTASVLVTISFTSGVRRQGRRLRGRLP